MNRGALLAQEKLHERGKKAALAKELEVDPGVVSRWLSGERTPDTVQRAHLEDKYGIGWRLWDEEVEEAAPASERTPTGAKAAS